jgi:hypothetical protein
MEARVIGSGMLQVGSVRVLVVDDSVVVRNRLVARRGGEDASDIGPAGRQ